MYFRLKNTKDFSTQSEENVFCLRGKFHDADIENELILGYRCFEEHGLNICAAQDALACELQNEILLGGWSAPPRKSKNRNVWMIRRMNMYIDEEDEDIDADDSWYEKSQGKLADDAVIEGIEARIREVETVQPRTIVSSEGGWGELQPLVDRMRKALLSDYPDVLADEIGTDPPCPWRQM